MEAILLKSTAMNTTRERVSILLLAILVASGCDDVLSAAQFRWRVWNK